MLVGGGVEVLGGGVDSLGGGVDSLGGGVDILGGNPGGGVEIRAGTSIFESEIGDNESCFISSSSGWSSNSVDFRSAFVTAESLGTALTESSSLETGVNMGDEEALSSWLDLDTGGTAGCME